MLFLKKNRFFGLYTIPIELETWYLAKMSLGRIYMLGKFQNLIFFAKIQDGRHFSWKTKEKYKKFTDFGEENNNFKLKCCFLCRLYWFLYIWNKLVFQKFQKNKMAAIFQCKTVNIKENAIKNELIDIKRSRKRGMVCFLVLW